MSMAVKVGVYWDDSLMEPAVRSVYQALQPGLHCNGCGRRLYPDERFAHHRLEEESLFLCGDCSGFEGGDSPASPHSRR